MKAEAVQPSSHSNKETLLCACLAGCPCRYDGSARPDPRAAALARGGAFTACPECLGGLPIPREPAEITGGDGFDVLDGRARVISRNGRDVTEAYLKGARAFLQLARDKGVGEILLKAKSPSCGLRQIHDGTHTGVLRDGPGVTAALLIREGFRLREI